MEGKNKEYDWTKPLLADVLESIQNIPTKDVYIKRRIKKKK